MKSKRELEQGRFYRVMSEVGNEGTVKFQCLGKNPDRENEYLFVEQGPNGSRIVSESEDMVEEYQ